MLDFAAEWFTSQAQLPTSTPNCGCFPPSNWVPPDNASLPASWCVLLLKMMIFLSKMMIFY